MSDPTTNITTKKAGFQGAGLIDIISMTDFPAPIAGVILLETNMTYRFVGPITTTDRFEIPADGLVSFESNFAFDTSLLYLGAGTLISSSAGPIKRFHLNSLTITLGVPGAKLADLTGDFSQGGDFITRETGVVGADYMTLRNFNLVVIENNSYVRLPTTTGGKLELINCVLHSIQPFALVGTAGGTGPLLEVSGPATQIISYDQMSAQPNADESFFYISPDVNQFAQINITKSFNLGAGAYFEKRNAGEFTLITPTIENASIDSVSDLSGLALFRADLGHGFNTGDQVTHSSFVTTVAYNGEVLITVVDPNEYTATTLTGVPIVFGINETGLADRIYREFTTTDTTGLGLGTAIKIFDTTSSANNGTFNVRAIDLNSTFSVPATFILSETGKWNTDSLNETDPRVNLINNGQQRDSKTIALGAVNNHVGLTTIASDVFVPLDVSGFSPSIVTERFLNTDMTLGLFTYIGFSRFQGFLTGALAALKTGATQNYRFAMSLNGGIPLFNAISSTAIPSVALGSLGRASFTHGGTPPPVGAFVTLQGFSPDSRYNTTGLVKASTATTFEVDGVLFAGTESGDYTANVANYVPMEVKTTKVVIPLLFSAILDPGETIQIMVAGEGTAQDLTVTDLGFGVF